MKFILAYTLCSAITGFCNNTMVHPVEYKSWSECAIGGAKITIELNQKYEKEFSEKKLYLNYFCNEVPIEKTPI
jgi:hypothetical protein